MKNLKLIFISLLVISTIPTLIIAHENEHDQDEALEHGQEQNKNISLDSVKLEMVAQKYQMNVKKLFKRACYNCHSSKDTVYPWYYKIPGIKQLINNDIEEAMEHIDMTNDFPFGGHGKNALDDLKAIAEELEEGEMPPFIYRFAHPESKFSKAEFKTIQDWLKESKTTLQN